jgi:hypothetical protein
LTGKSSQVLGVHVHSTKTHVTRRQNKIGRLPAESNAFILVACCQILKRSRYSARARRVFAWNHIPPPVAFVQFRDLSNSRIIRRLSMCRIIRSTIGSGPLSCTDRGRRGGRRPAARSRSSCSIARLRSLSFLPVISSVLTATTPYPRRKNPHPTPSPTPQPPPFLSVVQGSHAVYPTVHGERTFTTNCDRQHIGCRYQRKCLLQLRGKRYIKSTFDLQTQTQESVPYEDLVLCDPIKEGGQRNRGRERRSSKRSGSIILTLRSTCPVRSQKRRCRPFCIALLAIRVVCKYAE